MSSGGAGEVGGASPGGRRFVAGDRVLDCRIEREIGRGGMGTVFVARHVVLDRRVALKVLSSPAGFDATQGMLRFRREVGLLGRLDHPGIVKVLDAGTSEGVPFFTMELATGGSLAHALAALRQRGAAGLAPNALRDVVQADAVDGLGSAVEWRLPAHHSRAVATLVAEVAEALASAHAAGVVHRDVKPSNILFASDGRAMLADFGVARQIATGRLTSAGDVAGTPAYMAPEQARGEEVDHRADVFSLGVVLYEALTLHSPFPGGSAPEHLVAVAEGRVVDVRRRGVRIDADLAAIVRKAIDGSLEERFASAGHLAADLRAWLGGRPVAARRRGWVEGIWRWSRHEPWRAAAVAFLLVAVVAWFVLDTLHARQLEEAARSTAATLTELRQLSVGVRLDRAEAGAKPFRFTKYELVPAMDAWLRDHADPVVAALPELQRGLAAVRATALPYGDEEAAAARRSSPLADLLERVEVELSVREELFETREETAADRARRTLLLSKRDDLQRSLAERRTWSFATPERQFLHDKLAVLVERVTRFAEGPESLVGHVRAQRAHAIVSHRRCVEEAAATWREIAADVAGDPRFRGLQLSPQRDLLPLGKDATTGLWQFVHLRSGAPGEEVPQRRADGRIEPSASMGIVFVLLPGGAFAMGAQSTDRKAPNFDRQADPNEGPVRTVVLAPFFCGKYEVTQAQWARLAAGDAPSQNRSANGHVDPVARTPWNPVESVSQSRASDVLRDHGLVLPTEAQWEYACRSGGSTPLHFERVRAGEYANFADASIVRSGVRWPAEADLDDRFSWHAPVGSFLPNGFGLFDMHGNVAELVDDPASYYDRPAAEGDGRNLLGLENDIFAARGGSFAHTLAYLRSSCRRLAESKAYTNDSLGLRAVRSIEP